MKFWKLLPAGILIAGAAVALPAVSASASPGPALPAGVSVNNGMQYAPQLSHLQPVSARSTLYYSGNWAGYVDVAHANKPFTYVGSTFVMPKMTAEERSNCDTAAADSPSGYAEASQWVGLDGWKNGTVEQDGATSYCGGGVTDGIYVWYEMYPADPTVFTFTGVNPGDKVVAQTIYSGGKYTFEVNDDTNGKSFKAVVSNSKLIRGSAEVIDEDPGGGPAGGYYLADYGTATYTGSFVRSVSNTGTLSNSASWTGGNKVDEDYNSILMQSTSNLNSAGTIFSDTFESPGF
jgi:hypothetical protein